MPGKKTKIAVIGAGAIGGITAAFMKKAGRELEIVCKRQELADKICHRGIHVTGLKGEHRIRLTARKSITDLSGPMDIVFLATKANDCESAAKELDPYLRPESVVVSLQNGICEHALGDILGNERVIGCVVAWGASHNGPGELEVTSEGEFVIGNIGHRPDDRLGPVKRLLDPVNPTRISNNIMGELYSKLIVNACLNSLGVIGGANLGRLLADIRARHIFIKIMEEAMAVAKAMEIRVEPAGGGKLDFYKFSDGRGFVADLMRHLTIRVIGFKYRRIKSSSLQSIERGRRTEIDFLNGYICDRGREFGVKTPVNDAVRKTVLEIEEGKREMAPENFDRLAFDAA
jgi:2-dehydropantoate 2-reductase